MVNLELALAIEGSVTSETREYLAHVPYRARFVGPPKSNPFV